MAGRGAPGRLRRWLVRPLGWSLAALAIAVGLLAWSLRQGWLAERAGVLVEARLSELLGRAVRVERLDLSLVPLAVEAWGVTVAGPRPEDPPLAEVAHLVLAAEIEGIRHPVLTLHDVLLERPVFRLRLLADGSDNLPRLGRRGGGEGGRLHLRLAGLEIRDGWFELDEERVPLSLSARGIEGDLVGAGKGLLGGVKVEQVEVQLPRARPYRAAVSAQVTLFSDHLELRSVEVAGPELAAQLTGEVRWGGGPNRVRLAGRVETSDLLARDLGLFDADLAGRVAADAELLWQSGSPWSVMGTFSVPVLDFWNLGVEQVAGHLSLGAEQLTLDLTSGRALGGALDGRLRFDLASRPAALALDLGLSGAPLERLLQSREIELGAPLDADLEGRVRLDIPLGDAGEVVGAIELTAAPRGRAGAVALAGPLLFDLGGGRLTSRRVALSGEAATVDASGGYDLDAESGDFDYVVTTADLGALARLLPVERDPAAPPLWLPTAGSGRISGRLELRPAGVATRLSLELTDVTAPGLSADRVEGTLGVDPRGVTGLQLAAHRGATSVALSGELPFSELEPLALRIALVDWPYAAAVPWLPVVLPLDGPLRGDVELAGPLAALSGRARVALAPARVAGVDCERLEATLSFDPELVRVERAAASVPAGTLTASGTFGLAAESLEFTFAGEGLDLAAAPLSEVSPVDVAGRARIEGTLGGRLAEPELTLSVGTSGVTAAGESVPDSSFDLGWRGGELRVRGALLGLIEAEGGGALTRQQAALEVRLAVRDLPALAAIAGVPRELALAGSLEGSLRVTGDPSGAGPLLARLELPAVEVELEGHPISALEPVVLELREGRLEVRSLYLGERGTGSELVVSGRIGLTGERPLDLRLQASLPAALLARAAPALTLSGQIDGLGAIRGTLSQPRASGQVELSDGRVIVADFPHTFEQVQGSLLLYPDRVVLDSLSAELGGGKLRAGGTLVWEGTAGVAGPDYRLQVAAEQVSLRYPSGWLLRGDADLTLQSQEEGRVLRGSVRLDRAYYLQDLPANLGQVLGRLLERQRLQAAATDDLLAGTALALTLEAPQAVRVRNNLADLRGSAALTLRGTLGQPAVFGRVEAERGGKIVYSGTDYVVERARLTFSNPLRIEPVVDLEARAKVEQYAVTMTLAGTLDRLSASFTSDPPLPSLDVLGLLAVGQPLSGEGAAPLPGDLSTGTGGSSLQAEALLYSQAASIISSRVEGLFGLDKLRIDPLTTSRDVVSSARITVGKRLSRRVYVTYTLDPSTTEQQQVQVEWQVSDQLLVVLTQSGGETYAADLRWERRF